MLDWDSPEVRGRQVRLFPALRISSEREAEQRATAALCAMLRAVSEFGRAVVRAAGGPAGNLEAFTEVQFKSDDPKAVKLRPDAVLRVTRGKKEWAALVEVKVGDSPLREEQVADYHILARQEGFDAVLTISNQVALPDGLPPVPLDGRRLRGTPVIHLSWDRLLSEAQMLGRKGGVKDEDQQWMLEEWATYLADPASKIISQPDLGENWAKVLRAAKENSLAAHPVQVAEVVGRWESYMRKTSLKLRAGLGVEVAQRIPRSERQDPARRLKRLESQAVEQAVLTGELRIPDAVGDIDLVLRLPSKAVCFSVEVDAPSEGRVATRLKWLLRQLEKAETPPGLVIKVLWSQRNLETQARYADVEQDEAPLLRAPDGSLIDNGVTPRRFVIEWTANLKKSRGRSSAPVLDGITADLERFYRGVVEQLSPFVAKAPRLKRSESKADSKAENVSRAATPMESPTQFSPERSVEIPRPQQAAEERAPAASQLPTGALDSNPPHEAQKAQVEGSGQG